MATGGMRNLRAASLWGLLIAALAGVFVLLCIGTCFGFPCFPLGLKYGVWTNTCQDGDLRLAARVEAYGMVRGAEGTVSVLPTVRFVSHGRVVQATMYRGPQVRLSVRDGSGEEVPGARVGRPARRDGWRDLSLTLPESLPDGDYVLRAVVSSAFERLEVDVDLPLYAPAIAHLMTDRPLYRPGQEVLLRSVLLRRTDLAPLPSRTGRWRITDPDGDELLVEKGRAGAFGIAETTFPLDARATVGTWKAAWESGDARDEVTFEVRPFRLPRLSVEGAASARWYGIGDTVRIEGVARYTSGAPVADAPVQVRLGVAEGRWPLPLAWEQPFDTRTGSDGQFTVEVGRVPADLIERSVLIASLQVTEAAGEAATGATRLVLSKDDLRAEAVTELGDGLVGGFNNRAYLRVSTPDGRPLAKAEVAVTNPWDVSAEPRTATADEDGVLALQLDPGEPVTVTIPPPPARPRPVVIPPPAVVSASEVTSGRSLNLEERRSLDTVTDEVARCGDLTSGDASVALGVRVAASGAVAEVLRDSGALGDCVAAAVRRARFPTGGVRTYALTWRVPDSRAPSFPVTVRAAFGPDAPARDAWSEAALRARTCVPRDRGVSGAAVLTAHWRLRAGSGLVEATLSPTLAGTGLDASQGACVVRAFSGLRLPQPAKSDALGTATVTLSVPSVPGAHTPRAMTTTGYELSLTASVDGARIGQTNLVLPVGSIPPLRIRATPSIAVPGEDVEVELFRGPDYRGELPSKLVLRHGTRIVDEVRLDAETRKATFSLPDDRTGFLHVDVEGARAVVLVRPRDPLAVAVTPDRASYRPGDTAKLTVTTTRGEVPSPAAVGLVGVDSALAQLAPLLGPDDYGRVTVRVEADRPAFGAFDPRALALGQVRGANAARAAVLRISRLPMDPAGDRAIRVSATSVHDDEEVLVVAFYRALEALYPRVRSWEASAPAGEVMRPDRMVRMWEETITGLRRSGEPALDAFGRPLSLARLPSDLVAQVDPRRVVADKTRLPEDVVSWERYVAEEVGR